ncbi:MAG: hypothetical protein ABSC06_28235, partial [Rhodopila sp.]
HALWQHPRTPLVMVVDSQTQTISLIYQGQRGTENFWVLNSSHRQRSHLQITVGAQSEQPESAPSRSSRPGNHLR